MTEPGPFGGGLMLADSSAWVHAGHPDVVDHWSAALRGGQVVTSPVVELELAYTARDADELDAIERALSRSRRLRLDDSTARGALAAMRELARRQPRYQRMPAADYLIAAAAERAGADVLHYDRHFDRLAEVMGFESRWIAPAGSL